MTLPTGPLKCAGAPLKMTFMVADRLRQAGTLARSKVDFYTGLPQDTVFGVKSVNDNVLARWKALDIQTHYLQKLVAVDLGARQAVFATPEGERTNVGYDFLHVVPPMRAPDVVKNSELAAKQGPMAPGGWLEVSKDTLQHLRYPNVFGLGDIAGVPKGKTAASVKWQVPVAVDHIVAQIAGRRSPALYTGYTSCPLITRLGQAMLVEFDYENNLTPSFPGVIAPLEELWVSWVMKTMALKPTYISMLRGLA